MWWSSFVDTYKKTILRFFFVSHDQPIRIIRVQARFRQRGGNYRCLAFDKGGVEPLYTLLSESSLVDFVSISHTAKRLPPKIRICLVCYQKEIWSKQHGSNWGLQESQIRHSFSQVSEIFQISVDLASFQLLEKLKKVCPWHVQACPSGNFPTFI